MFLDQPQQGVIPIVSLKVEVKGMGNNYQTKRAITKAENHTMTEHSH